MALGVASVVLAMVANRIFAKLDYGLTGLMAAVLLHALNVVIATFSPTIHTLRLHYVEFFTKFYRPEGRGYVPFGSRSGVAS
jgi:V/A-type H+-transporting ATPase subunit I